MKQALVHHEQIAVAAAEEQSRLQLLLNESAGRVAAAEAQVSKPSSLVAARHPVTLDQVVALQEERLAVEEAQVGRSRRFAKLPGICV